MLVNEVFDEAVPYNLTKGSHGYHGSFSIGDIEFSVEVIETMPESLMSFQYMETKMGHPIDPMNNPEEFDKAATLFPTYEISFSHKGVDSYALTNTGNQYKVFTTVLAIISAIIKSSNPVELQFSAKESSRTKLYDRMIRVLSTKMGFKSDTAAANRDGSKDYVLVNTQLT